MDPVDRLARIADLIRDHWPTPQHAGGCGHQYDPAYPCRCGYIAEVKARDEALRLCQLDSVEDTL